MADEALYQARIAPQRIASTLTLEEVRRLRAAVHSVTHDAVKATTSNRGLPKDWLFHKRWGKRGGQIDGRQITHDKVGGRTTAWVPELQK
jgi:formamidopyrimidine-DNA glycosylase